MDAASFFQIVLYALGSCLLLVLIFLCIRLFFTLEKVDKLIDDINNKSKKLDGLFNSIDKITDAVSNVNDKFIGIIFNVLSNVKNKIKRKKGKDEEDE
ncbi:MAG: hypothetical protein E7157_05930 [Lactobacillales bacterium]|nr:hypothetical protein [Lactobacillales bacterium]